MVFTKISLLTPANYGPKNFVNKNKHRQSVTKSGQGHEV